MLMKRRFASPLRYPGGKGAIAPFLARLIATQRPRCTQYVEPFAGGAGAALRLLLEEQVDAILLNDIDPGVAAFWRSLLRDTDAFVDLVMTCEVSIEEWQRQRQLYENRSANDLELGFATFYLNRTNRSGILNARPIGGLDQTGQWLIDARFNRKALAKRIQDIGRMRGRIQVSTIDGVDLVRQLLLTDHATPEDSEQIAAEQVKVQETQRGFLIIPNFYAVYDSHAEPLTPKLKFSLALRVARDSFTMGGVVTMSGIRQATNSPRFGEGAQGYAKRLGSGYANAFSDIMLEGAILPTLLHQDPRYYYQGTGSKGSRTLHVITSLVIAKGDNGRWQPNYSGIGGNFASAALANVYYPRANRGAGLLFQNVGINTAVHIGIRMLAEFVFHPKPAPGGDEIWNSNPHL